MFCFLWVWLGKSSDKADWNLEIYIPHGILYITKEISICTTCTINFYHTTIYIHEKIPFRKLQFAFWCHNKSQCNIAEVYMRMNSFR